MATFSCFIGYPIHDFHYQYSFDDVNAGDFCRFQLNANMRWKQTKLYKFTIVNTITCNR